MATAYKINQFAITASNTSQTAFTATASNTVVNSVIISDAAGADVTLSVQKGSTVMQVATATLAAGASNQLLPTPLSLESTDKLMVTSTRASGSNVLISYVEDTNAVSGQSIGVLTDVPSSLGTAGQVLAVNTGATSLEYVDPSGGASELNDLSDATTTSGSTGDVLVRNSSGVYTTSANLQELRTLLKTGTGTTTLTGDGSGTSTDDGRLELTSTEGKVKFATDSEMTLTSTTARLKTGVTEVKMTETSPGDIEFIVATDSSGSTAFTAVHLDGLNTANDAQFIIKDGCQLVCEATGGAQGRMTYSGAGNAALALPTSSGTIALTSQLYTDADADGQIAAASVTDLSDVTSAGSGAIITSTERTKLSGIATGAEVNAVDSVNTQTGAVVLDADDISDASTTNKFTTASDISKLSGIEAGADVTDTVNVAAAGALMDSEVTNLAQVKSFDSSDYATAAQGNTADSALQDVIDDTSPELGGDLDVKAQKITTSTSNGNIELDPNGTGLVQVNGDTNPGAIKLMCESGQHGVTIQSPDHAEQADYSLTLPTTNGNANQVLKTDGNGVLSWTNQATGGGSPTAYDYDAFTTSANITMNADVSVASNKIVDIMGDALAAKNNANAKNFLGFHTGSGVCVLQGMVNASGSISGASAGSPLWLGASGAFSASAPSTANEYSRIVGYFVGSMQSGEVMCYFNPSQDWVQID